MPSRSPVVRVLNGLIELCWLFVLLAVPVFFNVRDYRVFEPDKIALLRNTVLVMVVLFLLKCLYVAPYYLAARTSAAPEAGRSNDPVGGSPAGRIAMQALRDRPIAVAGSVFALIYLLASLHALIPRISFWGSYDRLEGGYTYLTYLTFSLLVMIHLRRWAQLERMITAIIIASVPAAGYSWLQHFDKDPLQWFNPDLTLRTPSTMGNPIFLGAYLLMVVPFTLYRLVLRFNTVMQSQKDGGVAAIEDVAATIGYGAALFMQLAAFGFAGSRGPALGLLAALIVFALALAVIRRMRTLLRFAGIGALLIALLLGATNTVFHHSGATPTGGIQRFLYLLPSESGTSEVRSLLWKSSGGLIRDHLVLGCGPEVLIFCWYSNYPSELRKVEQANAAPDRSHDEELDVLLMSGILGLLSYLGFLGITIGVLVQLARRARDLQSQVLMSALLAAAIGHIVEGITGIAFASTLLLLWTIAAIATVCATHGQGELARAFAVGTEPALPQPREEPERAEREVRAPVVSGPSTKRSNESGRRNRQGQSGGRSAPARGTPGRQTPAYAVVYTFGAGLARLKGGMVALLGVASLLVIAVAVGCGALFLSNVRLVLADVDYRTGFNAEQIATRLTTAPLPAECGQGTLTYQKCFSDGIDNAFPETIASYQSALNQEPDQENYYLYLGKVMLEYADALNRNPYVTDQQANRANVIAWVQQALSIFQQAETLNPLNPDHPRNIAKLYDFWGAEAFHQNDIAHADIGKLELGSQSFALAHAIAPHNPDILEEWSALTVQIGLYYLAPARANDPVAQRKAHQQYDDAFQRLLLAESLDPESGAVYRDLGTVYAQYSTWATQRHDSRTAARYDQLTRQAWLEALKYAPSNYQTIYPRLVQLDAQKLNLLCEAGLYSYYGIKSIKAGTLDTSSQHALEGIYGLAVQNKCVLPK